MIGLKAKEFKIDNIELVIFDKDGTFIDMHKYWGKATELRAKKTIEYFGLDSNFFEPICTVLGYDLKTKLLPPDSPVGLYARDKVKEIFQHFLISKDVEASFEDIENIFTEVSEEFIPIQDEYTVIIPEAMDLMAAIKNAGCKMIVITSDSRESAKYTIEKRGLLKYFDGIYGAEDSSTAKTTGDVVRKALSELNINPQNTVCIGDTYDDFVMAKNSGLKACINVPTGIVPLEKHKEYNRYCISTLKEITVI